MKRFFITIILMTSTACAQNPIKQEVSYTIRPGEVRLVEFPLPKKKTKLTCKKQEISYQVEGDKARAIVTASYFSLLEPFHCKVRINEETIYQMNFKVEDRKYKSEVLKVNPKTIKLSEIDQDRVNREQEILNGIYAASEESFFFNRPFVPPMQTTVTSVYGTRRVYNKEKKGQHLGIDYRAFVGDKVPAVNRGKVVFAGDLFYTGWTVIIDHGLEIFTVYGHLSKTLVKAGEIVERGQLIAFSGNTGRTSGPHLHWGVKVQGQYIDGFVLIDESKKYYRE